MQIENIKQALLLIRERREARGFTQDELAARVGVSQSDYSRIEAGLIPMPLEFFIIVCEALLVDIHLKEL